MPAVFNFTFVPWFRSVAPYIHMHRGKTLVVGVPGEAIAAGALPNIVQDLTLMIWGPEDLLGPRAPGLRGAM